MRTESCFMSSSSVQFSSVAQSCPNLCDPMDCSTPGLPVHHKLRSLLRLMSNESVMPSISLILCRLLLLPPSIFPSIKVFSNESALRITWPKYWSFSFSISPSNEHPGLISFRMGWLDLLAVQGTLKTLLEHHSSKASIFRRSAFFLGLVYDFISGQNDYFLLQHLGSWLPSSRLLYGSRCPQGPHWVVRGGSSTESALLHFTAAITQHFPLFSGKTDTWPHLRTRTAGKYNTLCLAAVLPTRYQFSN